MKIAVKVVVCTIGLTGMIGQAAYADAPATPPPAHNQVCIDPSRIDHLSYPDDSTILFHMRGGPVRIWKNDLKRVCHGLKFEGGIAWEINGGEVCGNMQVFYVLRRWVPCMLGSFSPYTPPPAATPPASPAPPLPAQ
jgi:hypothetical protein